MSPSSAPIDPAMSRVRGGRKRASPPSSGRISSHSVSSSSVSRIVWDARRIKAPSSAIEPAWASLCSATANARAGKRGCKDRRRRSRPMPCRSGFSAWNCASISRSDAPKRSQCSGNMAISAPPESRITSFSVFGEHRGLRVRQRVIAAERGPVPVIRLRRQQRVQRLRHIRQAQALRVAGAAPASAAFGPARADRENGRRRACVGRRHRERHNGRRARPQSDDPERAALSRRHLEERDLHREARCARPLRPPHDAGGRETTGPRASSRRAADAASHRCDRSAREAQDRAPHRRDGWRLW